MTATDDGETVVSVFDASTARGAPIPWWLKIAAKLLLSCAPYRLRRRVGVSRHSYCVDYAGNRATLLRDIALYADRTGRPPQTLLELGPGDSVANALHAAAAGVAQIWLVDTGDFATADMENYQPIIATIAENQPDLAARMRTSSRAAMLNSIGARYLTGGTADLATIATGSVDLIVSYAVLEHVRRAEFSRVLAETYRVLAPTGLAFHWIDLMDHLGGRLDHLRLPERLWESRLFAAGGFYTNRLQFSDILSLARTAGFTASVPTLARWPTLPTPRRALSIQFAGLDDGELRVANFGLLLHIVYG